MSSIPSRATVRAAAFLLDVTLIGEAEARHRVATLWRPGSTLRATPGGDWLLVLGEPMEVRDDQAPGRALVAVDGGLTQPGVPATPDTVTFARHGGIERLPLAGLPKVSHAGWVDLAQLPRHELRCLDRPPLPVPLEDRSMPPEPDLRAAARIGRPSVVARRMGAPHARPNSSGEFGFRLAVVVLSVATFALIGIVIAGLDQLTGGRLPVGALIPGLIIGAAFAVKAALQAPMPAAAGSPHGGRTRLSSLILRSLILRSPVGGLIRSRHGRYLRDLQQQFQRRNWDEALRNAVGLGMGTGGGWTLRLPRRRESLTPTLYRGAGRTVPYDIETYEQLRALYLGAVGDLESAGRIEHAAFVFADLLDDPYAAVGVLERHDRLQLAAELAEARELDPNLVVRLWWRAGRRDHAVTVARTRNAFAGAVDRLSKIDTHAATELRREWVRSCQLAGDHVAAVEAAWPEESLRPLILDDIGRGIARGGPSAALLTAYLVSADPSPATVTGALALLADSAGDRQTDRDVFIGTLATLPGGEATVDRRICTAALRAVVRDGVPSGHPAWAAKRQIVGNLRNRADPLAVADLAPVAARRRATGGEVPHLNAAPEPGQLPVNDVATLANGSILLAHGDLGVRLVTIDGRTRARWDLPTHRLVVADHGGAALLLRTEGSVTEAHRLDLDSRRVTRWTAFAAHYLLRSYDGGVLIVIDRDGLAFLDTLAGRPRVIWRELTEGFVVHDVNRTPVSLSALIAVPAELPGEPKRLELWQWELPSVTLRRRRSIVSTRRLVRAVAVGGQLVGLSPVGAGEYDLWREDESGQRHIDRMVPQGSSLLADGDAYAIQTDTSIAVVQRNDRSPRTTHVTFPTDQPIGLRLHAGTINLWDRQGRVVCVNPNDPANAVSLRTSM